MLQAVAEGLLVALMEGGRFDGSQRPKSCKNLEGNRRDVMELVGPHWRQ